MQRNDSHLRYALLRAEIRRRMAADRKWHALPGLLDEMHSLRRVVRGHDIGPADAPGASWPCCRPELDVDADSTNA